jgi:predicted acylesterase/phospholipase RssA
MRMPALGDTLLRVMMIGGQGTAQRAREQGAFVITPPSLGVGMLEFHQLDRMVEAGRMAARALLDATGGDLYSPREELDASTPRMSTRIRVRTDRAPAHDARPV